VSRDAFIQKNRDVRP